MKVMYFNVRDVARKIILSELDLIANIVSASNASTHFLVMFA